MKKEDIHLYDIQRILMGDVPAEFYVELLLRSIFVYFMITLGMRLMGKRMSAQLSRTELAAIVTLASAGGLVLLAPDRGLLPSLIVLAVMLVIKWSVNSINYRHAKFEQLTEGRFTTLISEGVLQVDEMKKTRISKEQLFAQLRAAHIIHLGEVKRMYVEANGHFSLVKNPDPVPGLSVIPPWDEDFLAEQKQERSKVCMNCGHYQRPDEQVCNECKRSNKWGNAITVPEA